MLEKVDLSRKLAKKTYAELLPHLQRRLYDLEKACWDARIPTIVLFEGWDAAGKGTTINLLTSRLDPRGFKLHAIQAPRTYETHLPWLWRFWQRIPNYGEMAIFDRSWYGRVLVERVEGLVTERDWQKGYRDIASFERTLFDDGYVLVKFFLHISKDEQERRFKRLSRDPLTAWHVQAEDWEHHEKYAQYVIAIEEMLEHTDTEWGPWCIVEGTDRRWARIRVFQTIIHRMEQALTDRGIALPTRPAREARELDNDADSASLEEELEAQANAWSDIQEESYAGDA
jgi:polyphosphate kinase 2 (PPK2 family)